eukprot:TRINITY_DN20352_c0_g1_i1.p1 TRINITY_DN20352_c0_g1~~TRINITY_DN20352_c0_g1_i1.p1  ORF type:complete len:236 (+),score=50.72 TRINITY_DN20352_c0_g1_i1:84-791(+)
MCIRDRYGSELGDHMLSLALRKQAVQLTRCLPRCSPTRPLSSDRYQDFVSELPAPLTAGATGVLYAFSTASVTCADGITRSLSREEFQDTHGRTKQTIERQVGDLCSRVETSEDGTAKSNLNEAELAQFTRVWRGQPEADVPSWQAAWEPLVLEVEEYGFTDQSAVRHALMHAGGDVRMAVKELVEAERHTVEEMRRLQGLTGSMMGASDRAARQSPRKELSLDELQGVTGAMMG